MSKLKIPIVYDSEERKLRRAIEGAEQLDPSYVRLSSEPGNSLSVAGDGGLYGAPTDPQALVSTDENNQLVAGSDGALYVPPSPPPAVDALISKDQQNDIVQGSDGKLYANTMDNLALDEADKILSVSENGLAATVRMSYTASTGTIRLYGRNNALLGTVVLPKYQILQDFSIVENPDDQAPGTYIKFVVETTGGATQDVFLDVTKLVDVYTAADNSMTVSGYALSVNVDPNSPLAVGVNGLTVKLSRMISTDKPNLLKIGADNKFFVDGSAVETGRDVVTVDSIDTIPDELSEGGLLMHITA